MTPFTGEWNARLTWASDAPELGLEVEAQGMRPGLARAGSLAVVFDGVLLDSGESLPSGTRAGGAEPALVLAEMLARRGTEALSQLRGRFSLVVWDADRRELLAIRDPLGVRPLFHTLTGHGVSLVSPYLDVLLRLPGVDRTVDQFVAAGQLIAGLDPAPDETAFVAVRRIPPGHFLRVRDGRQELVHYWRPRSVGSDPRDVPERFGQLLEQSLVRCSDGGRFGVFLSGGIDSGTVATGAARVSRREGREPPVGLAVLNPTREASEETTQRAVADALALDLVATSPDEVLGVGSALRAALALAPSTPWPPGLLQPLGDHLARRAVASGCTVLLSGDGGDEWLAPFPSWAMERIARLDVPAIISLAQSWRYSHPALTGRARARSAVWNMGMRPFLSAGARRLIARTVPDRLRERRIGQLTGGWPAWFLPDTERREALADWWIARSTDLWPTRVHRDQKRKLLTRSSTSAMTEYNVATGRRVGAEMLTPLWDPDLIEFVLGLPPAALIDGGRAKALARQYMSQDIVFADDWPAKRSGDTVFAELLKREAEAIWDYNGGVPLLGSLGLVDEQHLARALRRPTADQDIDTRTLWDALALEAWLRPRIVTTHDATQA